MPTSNVALRAAKYCQKVFKDTGDLEYYLAYMTLMWLGTADVLEEKDYLTETDFNHFSVFQIPNGDLDRGSLTRDQ